jgi:hypothetical protein
MESASDGGRFRVLRSFEGGMSSPNPAVKEARIYNLATVPYLEYYYLKYSHIP